MKCPTETPQSVELLLAYTAGKLDVDQAAALAEHAAFCPACRAFTRAQGAVSQALDSWEAPPVSADFDRRLYQRIEQQVSWWDLILRPFRPMMGSRALPIAAAAGLLIAVGLWIEHPGAVPAVTVPESAQMEALPPDQAQRALEEMDMMQEFSQMVHADASDPRI
jgi:anti-sigma factor RsiW